MAGLYSLLSRWIVSCDADARQFYRLHLFQMSVKSIFTSEPPTIVSGHVKKKSTVWLNLCVRELTEIEGGARQFEACSCQLEMPDSSFEAFLEVVEPHFIALAGEDEVADILRYFDRYDDLSSWKRLLRLIVEGYDSGDNVNVFYLDGIPMWIDKATRVGLANSIASEHKSGRTETTLWYDTNRYVLPISVAQEMLVSLELYAIDCYGVTASHLAMIQQAQSIEELRKFDKTSGYPSPQSYCTH